MMFLRLRELRQIFNMDLEVQFVLKQGLVEVDPGVFIPNYKTALLIHRHIVEELNKRIEVYSVFIYGKLVIATYSTFSSDFSISIAREA